MTIEKLDASTPDLTQQNVERLLDLFPECRTEGTGKDALMVDFDLLRQALSDHLVDGPAERYRLDWPGKRQALLTANTPIDKTLRPLRDESVDFDTTRNLFIEGDNLDALKLLQETYLGKVKMIYIDPPYNTGKDFVYRDNFTQSRSGYEEESGQIEQGGGRLVANPETHGRFHSNWLNMLHPRLKLAKHLLADEGYIFVSIDDSEIASLRHIMDEVFGPANFAGVIKRRASRKTAFLSKNMTDMCDYIVAYSASEESDPLVAGLVADATRPVFNAGNGVSSRILREGRPARCEDCVIPKGQYTNKSVGFELLNDIEILNGRVQQSVEILAEWRINQTILDETLYVTARKGFRRTLLAEEAEKPKLLNDLLDEDSCYNEVGTEELAKLGLGGVFDHPKPTPLVVKLMEAVRIEDDDFFLDFFAGSGTSAHAAYNLAGSQGAKVNWIVVQWPEVVDQDSAAAREGFANLAQVARERVRRAGDNLRKSSSKAAGTLDVGFRAFRIDSGNFVDTTVTPKEATQDALFGMVSHIKDDRSDEDLLFGALLRWGIDITLPIEQRDLAGRTVWIVDAPEDGSGTGAALIACFVKPRSNGEGGVDAELADALAELAPLRVLFRDDGFANDATKENVHSRFQQRAPDTQVRVL